MKYLNRFNESINHTYFEIREYEYNRDLKSEDERCNEDEIGVLDIKFTDIELKKLREIFKNDVIPNIENTTVLTDYLPYQVMVYNRLFMKFRKSTISTILENYPESIIQFIYITPIKDEWFYVSLGVWSTIHNVDYFYYKCDRWDGLLDCLEDIKKKLPSFFN